MKPGRHLARLKVSLEQNPGEVHNRGMSEEKTQDLNDERSFEERVFARFDSLDARMERMEKRLEAVETKLHDLDVRVQKLEDDAERRAMETKPIWERALAEIIAVGQKVDAVERKLNVLGLDMLTLRADQTRLESRMDKLESERAS
jgi:chromosome segregation ATPase